MNARGGIIIHTAMLLITFRHATNHNFANLLQTRKYVISHRSVCHSPYFIRSFDNSRLRHSPENNTEMRTIVTAI
ncbi:MAG: hypothetical protein KBS99_02940 [Prevotellaceae bacterium]|nr:hypothetical protein [Candidatus Colivivens caballi]